MGWIEALGADVTPGAGPADHPIGALIQARAIFGETQALGERARHGVAAAQGVAVVFHQPQVVLAAEGQGDGQIKRIAQGMGHHHCLRFAWAIGQFQLVAAGIAGDRIGIDEHRHRTHLHDRRHGGGEPCSHRDHLIARLEAPRIGQLGGGEGRDCHQVGRRAGIHQQAVAYSHEGRQLLFHGGAFGAEGEPEIEGCGHRCLHLLFAEHPAGIRDGTALLPRSPGRIGGGAEGAMAQPGKLACVGKGQGSVHLRQLVRGQTHPHRPQQRRMDHQAVPETQIRGCFELAF